MRSLLVPESVRDILRRAIIVDRIHLVIPLERLLVSRESNLPAPCKNHARRAYLHPGRIGVRLVYVVPSPVFGTSYSGVYGRSRQPCCSLQLCHCSDSFRMWLTTSIPRLIAPSCYQPSRTPSISAPGLVLSACPWPRVASYCPLNAPAYKGENPNSVRTSSL